MKSFIITLFAFLILHSNNQQVFIPDVMAMGINKEANEYFFLTKDGNITHHVKMDGIVAIIYFDDNSTL